MKYYELTCLISPHFSEEKLMACLPGKPTKKQLASSLITVEFYAEPDKIKTLEEKLKSESSIQRYIILNKKVPKVELKLSKKIGKKPKSQTAKPKVELKEIEKKLEEILKE